MKNWIKKLANAITYMIVGGILFTAASVYAINVTVPQSTAKADILAGNANGTYRVLNVGSNGQCLTASSTTVSGLLWASCAAGGSVTGTGINGFAALWNSTSALTTGTLRDNGTVSGVNATSSTVNFNIQGTMTLDPLNVASSSGTSALHVYANGDVGIANQRYTWPGAQGTQGQFLGNTGTGILSWLTPTFVTVCSSGCNYTATGTGAQVGINAAITAVNAGVGGTVLVKAGTYRTSTGTSITMLSNVKMLGEGDATQIISTATSTDVVSFSAVSNSSMENLKIDGGVNVSKFGINGASHVQVLNSNNLRFNKLTFTNINGFGFYIPTTGNATSSVISITDSIFESNAHQDIIGGGPNAVGITPAQDLTITGNHFVVNLPSGGTLNSNVDANCFDVVQPLRIIFNNNVCYGRALFGNEKYPATYSEISNNIFNAPNGTTTLISGSIMVDQSTAVATTVTRSLIISNNVVQNGRITAKGSAAAPLVGVVITGNSVTEPISTYQDDQTAGAIALDQVTQSFVNDNWASSTPSGTTGIRMTNTTNTSVSGNTLVGFLTGIDGGSGTGNKGSLNNFINVTTKYNNMPAILELASGGNLGVGTSTPAQSLVVVGSTTITSLVAGVVQSTATGQLYNNTVSVGNGGTGATTFATNGILFGSGTSAVNASSNFTFDNAATPLFQFVSGNASNYASFAMGRASIDAYINIPGGSGQWSPDALAGDLVIRNQTGNTLFNTSAGNANALLTLTKNGTVGISSTTPIGKLAIVGTSGSTTPVFIVSSSTNASPAMFQVGSDGNITISKLATSFLGCVQSSSTGVLSNTNVACSSSFWGSATNGTYLSSGYLVGINSTTPTANLVVQGSSTAPTIPILNVATSTGASFLQVTAGSQILACATCRLTIPQAAAPTLTAAGDVAVATTTGTFTYHDGTAQRYLNPEHLLYPFYIENPAANEDIGLWIANATTTITKILCVNKGTKDTTGVNLVWDNSRQTSTTTAISRVFTSFTACAATTTPTSIAITGSTTVNTLQSLRFITSTASSSGMTLTIFGRDNQ